jgi:hypothetical protein
MPIDGYEDSYEVSDGGDVRSKDRYRTFGRSRVLKRCVIKTLKEDRDGYFKVWLSKGSKKTPFFVHRLVATMFLPNPSGLPVVNHIDGNKQNNSITNLEWCTISDNTKHAFRIGLRQPGDGGMSKPVYSIDPFTNAVVKRYPSLSEAGRELGTSVENISMAANGVTKTAKGLKWAFVSEGVTTIESVPDRASSE